MSQQSAIKWRVVLVASDPDYPLHVLHVTHERIFDNHESANKAAGELLKNNPLATEVRILRVEVEQ